MKITPEERKQLDEALQGIKDTAERMGKRNHRQNQIIKDKLAEVKKGLLELQEQLKLEGEKRCDCD